MWSQPTLKGGGKKTYMTNRVRARRSSVCRHTLHACGSVCVCFLSAGLLVFIFALMFRLHVLSVLLSSCNKLPYPLQAPRLCPFGVYFSLLSFCLKPALSYHPGSLPRRCSFSPPASLSPCEVCDLCNFILPVTGDISQSRSMNIDELIQITVSKRPDTEISGSHSSNGHPSLKLEHVHIML